MIYTRNSRPSAGFTLLELMLVLMMCTLVWLVLLPALTTGHEDALDAACRANLRQLALTANDYALATGYYPWGYIDPQNHDDEYDCRKDVTRWPRERPELHGITSWKAYASFCWDFRRRADEKTWQTGEMFEGSGQTAALCCPKTRLAPRDNWDGNQLTGYNYNVCFIGYCEGDRSGRTYPLSRERLLAPELVVIFGDGGYEGGCNKFMRAPKADKYYDNSSASLRKAGTQAFRHGHANRRHTNMAFADGHVEAFSRPYKTAGKEGWVDERTHSAFISAGNGIYGPRGWHVNDND